jgi:hypothetical protein
VTVVGEQPDLTLTRASLRRTKGEFRAIAPAHWFLRDMISTSKKQGCVPWSNNLDVARAPGRWPREQFMFDPARLVFIDER